MQFDEEGEAEENLSDTDIDEVVDMEERNGYKQHETFDVCVGTEDLGRYYILIAHCN